VTFPLETIKQFALKGQHPCAAFFVDLDEQKAGSSITLTLCKGLQPQPKLSRSIYPRR
jgi:hypothetical protein